MTIINLDSSTVSWSSVTKKTFFNDFSQDPKGNIQSLTQSMAQEIFDDNWCSDHNIHNTKHRNRLVCKVISTIGQHKISSKIIHLFFQTLSSPTFELFPLKHPLFIPLTYEGYLPYSKSDFHVQLGLELKKALEADNDELAQEIARASQVVTVQLLEIAVRKNCFHTVEILLSGNKYNQASLDSILISTCRYQSLESVILLLKKGANPNFIGRNRETAIHSAAANKNPSILKAIFELSKHKIDTTTLQSCLRTPLEIAYQESSIDHLDLLLNNSDDPDIIDGQGLALLHHMCILFCNSDFNPIAIDLLVQKYHANVNLFDKRYIETPIHMALTNSWHEMTPTIHKLIEYGADITLHHESKNPPVIDCIDREIVKHILPFFSSFPKIIHLLTSDLESEQLTSNSFLENLKASLKDYLTPADETANPLNIVLLLQDIELAIATCKLISSENLEIFYERTQKQFPGSNLEILDNAIKQCSL
jgi:ankyrin repeat protein